MLEYEMDWVLYMTSSQATTPDGLWNYTNDLANIL